MVRVNDDRRRTRRGHLATAGLLLGLVLAVAVLAATVSAQGSGPTESERLRSLADPNETKDFWANASTPRRVQGRRVAVHARKFRPVTLNTAGLRSVLASVPRERTIEARSNPLVVSLPAPNGAFHRFALQESAIMAPGLARRHPEIKTYSGRGISDLTATIHADLSPLGFRASIRTPRGAWYIDPYYVGRDRGVYASYYAHYAQNTNGPYAEREPAHFPGEQRRVDSVGDQLRTYRTALITDPGYSTYHGGPQNVTAAKVALMNRVTQIYEDDLAIRLQLIAGNDLLNLNTYAEATAPNGPCGAAPCFTQPQVTGCSSTTRARTVIGQIIGASNYDLGHLGLGQPGGGVANLGVVGRSNKAGGCTGVPTPVGDFFAVDYVAHEIGHQFAGNHTFNGNQLNCSGGNRSGPTSVEPGSGQSIMAYAGICLTDDLQPHSDGYFSQRSQQEITGYVTSNYGPINEVQTVSLRHFGGGNEIQAVTFGPGYGPVVNVAPLTVSINSAPSSTSRGGAEENGTTVTIATGSAHSLQAGDVATVSGVGVAGYNGTFTVTAVPSSRSFQYTNPVTGLAVSGGGTVTPAVPGASSSGTTATIKTTAVHNRSVGDIVTVSGVGIAGYNGTVTITSVPTARTFQYTIASALGNSGGGSVAFFSPFRVRIGGNDSALIGGSGLPYTSANLTSAINAIAGFPGTVSVSGATSAGFTIAYSGASAGLDVANIELVELVCTCFASVQETNHGGTNDSFRLNYGGNVSGPITNGVNYTAVDIQAALAPLLPAGGTATVAGFGGNAFNNTGFQVTYGGTLGVTNVPVLLGVEDFTPGASGFTGETDKGGAVDNQGIVTPTGNNAPFVTAPAGYTIPLRTPFALTASATDPEGDTILYSWEQNDIGGSSGVSLLNNVKANGPLFAMFPRSAPVTEEQTLLYNSPNENHITTSPTRVIPDLEQILSNNTNADAGVCGAGPIAPPVSIPVKECFSEFLPTSDYVLPALHFRVTARDLRPGGGGYSFADLTVTLAGNAGPFRVTAPNAEVTYPSGSVQTVHWDKANTDIAPISASAVKISLSTDGGATYSYVLAENTANDGSEAVTIPVVATGTARVKIEAVGNVFFDVSNTNFGIAAPPAPPPPPGGIPPPNPPPPPPPPPPAPPARCRVPNVIGLKLATARTRIRARKCRVGRVRKARSRRVGRVVKQSPRGGAVRARNFKVTLVVGRR